MDPLITIEDLNERLSGTGVTQAYVDGVSGFIRKYCGWHVAPEITETITLDGHGGTILHLPTLHVVSLGEVKVQGSVVADVEWSTAGMLRGNWPNAFRSVEVTFTHGFASAPDLLAVAMDAMARASLSELGGQAETIGPFSFGASEGGLQFFAHELAVLDSYRLERQP